MRRSYPTGAQQCAPATRLLSPLLANVALSVLDEHFARRARDQQALPRRHQRGLPWFRLVRYADDWILLVRGDRAHVEALRGEAAAVLALMGLRLSDEKTKITHVDGGLDFLGWRIQRHRKPADQRQHDHLETRLRHVSRRVPAGQTQDHDL
jgi:RNA-directed DNA polymerase